MTAAETEQLLIARAVAGDNTAFCQLTRQYQGVVRGMLRQLCRNNALADDLSQQTFIKAWQKLAGYRGGHFQSWLCTIAYRELMMHQRSQPHSHYPLDDEAEPPCMAASTQLQLNQQMDLQRAVALLPQQQANIVILHAQAGLTHLELAELLTLPLGTVKSHISRAVKQLQQLMQEPT